MLKRQAKNGQPPQEQDRQPGREKEMARPICCAFRKGATSGEFNLLVKDLGLAAAAARDARR